MKTFTRTAAACLLSLPTYALFSYVVMPVSWRQYYRLAGPPALSAVTRTAEGIAADPLNVALVGTRNDVVQAMRAAGWCPADRITLRSGLRDATSVLFHRPYASAPVSTHLLWERPQDLAFEQSVGGSPRRRHHVRLWQANQPLDPRNTIWLGAATYDLRVGFSRYTGEIIHHIEPRVDAERDTLVEDLGGAGRLGRVDCLAGLRAAGRDRNGSGDDYETDGRLCIAVLRGPLSNPPPAPAPAEVLQELRAAISRSWSRERLS